MDLEAAMKRTKSSNASRSFDFKRLSASPGNEEGVRDQGLSGGGPTVGRSTEGVESKAGRGLDECRFFLDADIGMLGLVIHVMMVVSLQAVNQGNVLTLTHTCTLQAT